MTRQTAIASIALKGSSVLILAIGGWAAFQRLRDVLGPWAGHDDRPATLLERTAYYLRINLSDALFNFALAILAASGCWLIARLLDQSPSRPPSLKALKGVALAGLVAGVAGGLLRQDLNNCLWMSMISLLGALGVWALAEVGEKIRPAAEGSFA